MSPRIFALLFVPGLVAMPILGWVAVSRIRHSSGRLYGLGLAVFDGLFIPLIVLDSLLVWLCGLAVRAFPILLLVLPHGPTPAERLFALQILAAITADFFIARAVWRLANAPPGNASAKPAAAAPQPVPFTAKLSLGLLLLGLLGTPLLLALAPASSQDAIAVFAVLSLLLAVIFGLISRSRLGYGIAIGCVTVFITFGAWTRYRHQEIERQVGDAKSRMTQRMEQDKERAEKQAREDNLQPQPAPSATPSTESLAEPPKLQFFSISTSPTSPRLSEVTMGFTHPDFESGILARAHSSPVRAEFAVRNLIEKTCGAARFAAPEAVVSDVG